jgi:hypothetical protein
MSLKGGWFDSTPVQEANRARRRVMSKAEDLMSECDLDSLEDAEFLLTLPPEATYLVQEGAAWIGCDHMGHDWPKGVENPCKGKPHGKVLALNMGDTFCYACADAEHVKPEQLVEVTAIYKRFGGTGLDCWAAKQRNENPVVEVFERPEYQKAWKALYGDLKVQDNYCNKITPRW